MLRLANLPEPLLSMWDEYKKGKYINSVNNAAADITHPELCRTQTLL